MAELNLDKQKAFNQLQGIKRPRDKKGRFTKNQEYYIWEYHQPNPEDFKPIKRKVDTPPPEPIPPKNTIVIDGVTYPTKVAQGYTLCGSCGGCRLGNNMPQDRLLGQLCVAEGEFPDVPDHLKTNKYQRQPLENFHKVVQTMEGPVTVWWSMR